MLIFAAQISAAITVVQREGNDVIQPIESIKPPSNNSQFSNKSVKDVEEDLYRRYGSIDKMLLNANDLNKFEQKVLRKIALADYQTKSAELENLKKEHKREVVKQSIENKLKMDEVLQSPEYIKKTRKIKKNAEKAMHVRLHQSKINIETRQLDPTTDQQVHVNAVIDRPIAILFFDSLGTPYPITKTIPNKTNSFAFETVSENQLIVSAKAEYRDVAGFIFLEGVPQPIPVLYTSNPEMPVDTKMNYILPTISPKSTEIAEDLTVPVSQFANSNDPVMYQILNGRPVKGAKQLLINGLPPTDRAYKYKNHIYFRTKSQMSYDILSAKRLGGWYAYKAHPRPSYWFVKNQREIEVTVHEKAVSYE